MPNLQQEIAAAFLRELENSPDLTAEMLEGLRELLSDKKKLKADDLVKVFSPPPGDVK